MKKMVSLILVIVMCGSLLTGCGDGKGSYTQVKGDVLQLPEESTIENAELNKMYSEFSMHILKTVHDDNSQENILISPASILFALNMAALGAEGDTYTEMTDLYAKGATKYDIAEFSKNMRDILESSGIVNVANSLWINKDVPFRADEAYLNLLRQYFSAAATQESFSNHTGELLNNINGWIKEKTNGMIDNALNAIDIEAFMYIINALVFEGKWKEEYEDYQITYEKMFKSVSGKNQPMKSMNSSENMYLEYGGAKGFKKNYDGEKMSFVAILPEDENITIQEFLNNCQDDFWTQFYDSRKAETVIALLPSFSFDYTVELSEALKKLGMVLPFSLDADFSGMASSKNNKDDMIPDDSKSLAISQIIHKTHIELDEKGTKAAAATVLVVTAACDSVDSAPPEPKEVILDRPFAFAIVDNNTGLPVFMGIINTME